MPGPGGRSFGLMDMMSDQPAVPAVNPNLSSAGAQMAPYFGGGVSFGPGGGAGGYGGGVARTPPELAQYFGAFGQPVIDDPRKVASEGGISAQDLARGMFPRGGLSDIRYDIPSDQGGFFRLEDLYGLSGTPTAASTMGPQRPGGPGANQQVYRAGAQSVPAIGTEGANLPSTNNWRLLGMGPGWIMRNGRLINTRAPEVGRGMWLGADLGGGLTAEQGDAARFNVALGTGAPYGQPGLFARGGPAMAGWPGATNWQNVFGGNV